MNDKQFKKFIDSFPEKSEEIEQSKKVHLNPSYGASFTIEVDKCFDLHECKLFREQEFKDAFLNNVVRSCIKDNGYDFDLVCEAIAYYRENKKWHTWEAYICISGRIDFKDLLNKILFAITPLDGKIEDSMKIYKLLKLE